MSSNVTGEPPKSLPLANRYSDPMSAADFKKMERRAAKSGRSDICASRVGRVCGRAIVSHAAAFSPAGHTSA
jgi:hypothetical protein